MTFLNPAILLGLIAASIPVVLHFLNLRKLKKIEFSTLAFLKELQKSKIRRIKLKQWLLLLLRILIITFLVLAFARPKIENVSFGSSSAKTTAVIIIDNTFSMSVVSGNGSYFNRAKQISKSLLNNFQSGDEIAVIPVVESSKDIIKPRSNFNAVKKEIDELYISYASSTLNEAVIKAAQIIYESKNFNKEIYLLTDLQDGRISGAKSELSNLSRLLSNTKVYLIDLNEKAAANLGIDSVSVNNQIFEKNKTLGFSAIVHNYSKVAANNALASLYINGKRSAQQSYSIQSNQSAKLDFETTLLDTGLVEAYVELEDDDLNQDNKRFVSFYVPDKINILLLVENSTDSKFIKLTLENSSAHNINLTEASPGQLPMLNLHKYDGIIFFIPGKQNNIDKLIAFAESGKGILIFPASNNSIQSVRAYLNYFNIPEPVAFIGKQNDLSLSAQFGKTDLQHPLFSDFFENKSKTKIESPEIFYYAKILTAAAGKTIISMFDNSAFLSEYKIGAGKLLVFNSTPVLSSSTFPLKSIFAPLINKSVLYVSSKTNSSQNIFAGSSITANIQGASGNQIKIERPNGFYDYINTDSLINKNFIQFNNTDITGVYRFYSDSKLIDFASVNCDPKESATKYDDISTFENYLNEIGYNGSVISIKPDEDLAKAVYQSRFGVELWKYFLILALIFALVEMFISKSSKKDIAGI